jgi:predicted double-glycine peptidase
MNPWLESIGVVLLGLLGAWLGRWCSRRPAPWWTLGYFVPLLLVVLVALPRWLESLTFVSPFCWLTAGRREYALLALAGVTLLITPLSRLVNRRQRVLVMLFAACFFGSFSLEPFLGPAWIRSRMAALQTQIDANGVCRQGTDYTCGPAAAVTGLRRLGIAAEEGEIAILARTSPVSGTDTDLLMSAMAGRYGREGIIVKYQDFKDLSALREAGLTLAVVKHSFLVDHYVTVLEVTDQAVVVGDPLEGRVVYPPDAFKKKWRFAGLVIRRRLQAAAPRPAGGSARTP